MDELLTRIAEALERIADALENLEMDQEITSNTLEEIHRRIRRRGGI